MLWLAQKLRKKIYSGKKSVKKTFLTKYYQDKDGKFALSTDFQNNQQY